MRVLFLCLCLFLIQLTAEEPPSWSALRKQMESHQIGIVTGLERKIWLAHFKQHGLQLDQVDLTPAQAYQCRLFFYMAHYEADGLHHVRAHHGTNLKTLVEPYAHIADVIQNSEVIPALHADVAVTLMLMKPLASFWEAPGAAELEEKLLQYCRDQVLRHANGAVLGWGRVHGDQAVDLNATRMMAIVLAIESRQSPWAGELFDGLMGNPDLMADPLTNALLLTLHAWLNGDKNFNPPDQLTRSIITRFFDGTYNVGSPYEAWALSYGTRYEHAQADLFQGLFLQGAYRRLGDALCVDQPLRPEAIIQVQRDLVMCAIALRFYVPRKDWYDRLFNREDRYDHFLNRQEPSQEEVIRLIKMADADMSPQMRINVYAFGGSRLKDSPLRESVTEVIESNIGKVDAAFYGDVLDHLGTDAAAVFLACYNTDEWWYSVWPYLEWIGDHHPEFYAGATELALRHSGEDEDAGVRLCVRNNPMRIVELTPLDLDGRYELGSALKEVLEDRQKAIAQGREFKEWPPVQALARLKDESPSALTRTYAELMLQHHRDTRGSANQE